MSKVLISFLGTGPDNRDKSGAERKYKTALYHFDNGEEFETSFIADALFQHYNIDRLILIGTPKSMWEHVYERFCEKNNVEIDEGYWIELSEFCDKASHETRAYIPGFERIETAIGNGSKVLPIRYGLNEEELQENAATILGVEEFIQKGDELYVDITHSFRSLPMYLMNLLIYLRNVSDKKPVIKCISYGMLDVTREFGYTPVVELNSIIKINDWITGAYAFQEFGKGYQIANLIKKDGELGLTKQIETFSDALGLNNLYSIKKQTSNLRTNRLNDLDPIQSKIIPKVFESFCKKFPHNVSDARFLYNLATWHFQHKNFSAAYMVLLECILSDTCTKLHFTIDIDHLEQAKYVLGKSLQKGIDKNTIDEQRRILMLDEENETLQAVYNRINNKRNAFTHMIEINDDNKDLVKLLKESISSLASVIK